MSKALEMLPVAIFFILYKIFNIFIATVGLVITTLSLTIVEYIRTRKISKFNLINLLILLIMSGITLISEDASFIKMKPTFLYLCLALFLLFDLLVIKKLFIGKIYQKIFDEKGVVLGDRILKKFTTHWILLLFMIASANEVIWRGFGEDLWVNFKVFFVPIIMFCVMIWHVLYIGKHEKKS